MERETLVADIRRLANQVLPPQSTWANMPVCRNHCFMRIAYDNAVGQKWDMVVKAPFLRNATLQQLSDARAILYRIADDPSASHSLNDFSLFCRQKGGYRKAES